MGKNVFFKLCNLAVTIGLAIAREGYHRFDINPAELWETLHFSGFRKLALKYWPVGLAEMYRDLSKATFLKSLQRYVLNA